MYVSRAHTNSSPRRPKTPMATERPHRLKNFIFHALLLIVPLDVRREYGPQIWRDFSREQTEREQAGSLASMWLFLCVCGDLVAIGLRERYAAAARDVVFALRSLRKTPLFTIVIIATLAVAIGANAAVFSVLRSVVLAPLPYAEPQNLVAIFSTRKLVPNMASSLDDAEDIRTQNRVFTDVAFAIRDNTTLTGVGKPQVLDGVNATWPAFDVLGTRPELGRFFNARDEKSGGPYLVVISDRLWRTKFGADATAIGRIIKLDALKCRVIGVAPPRFQFPLPNAGMFTPDYWAVVRPSPEDHNRADHALNLIARLRPGTSVAAANADVTRIATTLAARYPATNSGVGARVVAFADEFIGGARPLLNAALAAVLGIVLIACANVSNLLLSRGAARDGEFAIRNAIGATRRRIVTQILTETLLLAAVSGVLGIALGFALVQGFVALDPPGIPRLDEIGIDGNAIAYTFAIVGLCVIASGIVPALALSRPQLVDALKVAGRGGDASRGARARNLFVVLEIAISVALVMTSGLIVRSFMTLANTPLGIATQDVHVAAFPGLPEVRYGSVTRKSGYFLDSVARVRAVPGVRSAAWATTAPLLGKNGTLGTVIEGHPTPIGAQTVVNATIIGPEYFLTLGISLRFGREFTDDDRVGSAPVAIVDEAFARKYFNGNAIGRWIIPGITLKGQPPRRTIVGVVGNVRRSFAGAYDPNVYLPNAQLPGPEPLSMLVNVRPGVHVDTAIAAAMTARDPLIAPPKVRNLQVYADAALARTRVSALLLGFLGFIALFLAISGVYSVVSFGVAQRTHEFGIRAALGAHGGAIVRNVLTRAARLFVVGILGGVVLAGFAADLSRSLLFEVSTLDPSTYAIVVFVVAIAALLAALIPALRATRVDPVVALRQL
jgi:predicted permease